MSIFIGRRASKLWKRICTELIVEVKSLMENWMYLLGGLIFQYIHGVAARGVHYLHRPGPTLQDLGFFLLPELGPDKFFISEVNFTIIFLSFALWTLHPFIFKTKRIYTVLSWCRVLACLSACQALRIITFYSTQLPGPAHHCREGAKLARLPLPKHYYEFLIINIPQGTLFGCGDLIFSSHMIFSLVFVRTYHKYGSKRLVKQIAWFLVIAQSFLIVASRKHYTVDVVVAWYTVNLVVFFLEKRLGDMPDRSAPNLSLPLSKDSRTKEEMRPLSGSCGDFTDWRYRSQANGKTADEGNSAHVDVGNNV